MLHVVGAGENAIELCVFVPPNDRKKIQPSCGSIGMIILNQSCATRTEGESRNSFANAPLGKKLLRSKVSTTVHSPRKAFTSLSNSGPEPVSTDVTALSACSGKAKVKRLKTGIR